MFHFLGRLQGCAYTVCSYGQIHISYAIPSGSAFSPNGVSSSILCVQTYCIRLLWDWSFCLSHHIIFTCYFVASAILFPILFKIPTFPFSFCVSVSSVAFGCVMFWLLLLGVLIRFQGYFFSVISVTVTVLGSNWHVSLFFCLHNSNNPMTENQPCFIIILIWPASLWLVALNLTSSSQISTILFLYPLSVGLLLKQL